MPLIPLTIQNGSSGAVISIKIVGDATERYVGFAGGNVAFVAPADNQSHTYELVVQDGDCRASQFFNLFCTGGSNPPGGGGSQNPAFNIGIVAQPSCTNNSLGDASVQITGISHADRYKILVNGSFLYGGSCTSPDGSWSGDSGLVILPHPPAGQSITYTIRAYNGTNCGEWYDQNVTILSPACSTTPPIDPPPNPGPLQPFFTISVQNPTCSNGSLTAPQIAISNGVNLYAYSFTTGSSYSGSNDCSNPFSLYASGTGYFTVPAPAPGQSQQYTVRGWPGTGCSTWYDVTFTVSSPSCSGASNVLGIVTLNFHFDNDPLTAYSNRFNTNPPPVNYKTRAMIESGSLAGQSVITEHGNESLRFVGGNSPDNAIMVSSYDPMGYPSSPPPAVFNRTMISCNRLRQAGYTGTISVALYVTRLSTSSTSTYHKWAMGSQGTNAGDIKSIPRSNGADFTFSGTQSTDKDFGEIQVDPGSLPQGIEVLKARCFINLDTNSVVLVGV